MGFMRKASSKLYNSGYEFLPYNRSTSSGRTVTFKIKLVRYGKKRRDTIVTY